MKNLVPTARKLLVASALLLLLAVWMACAGGAANIAANSSVTNPGSLLTGSWTITVSDSSYPDGTFNARLAPGPCTIGTPVGVYGEDMAYCFVADNTGQGALSGTGSFFYPPTEVLVNTAEVFTPTNPTIGIGMIFIEGDPQDPNGNFAVFSGTGTLTVQGIMSGWWMCAYGPCTVNLPSGGSTSLGGTFTGTK